MGSSVLVAGSVITAFMAGVIALFAPCCISVMLPAYFANSFRNRGMLVAMTFLFAAGIATVILPLTLGASVLRQLFITQHTPLYVGAGLLMLTLAAYMLAGGQMHLPMPGRRAGNPTGALSVYSLGVFSGVASSCCAPVLAGVIALSGIAQSFSAALGLGVAYVFGMVAPLFVISLLWDRFDWRSSWLFKPRQFTWRIGPVSRTISGSSLAAGLLLAAMGAATIWAGVAYDSMLPTSDWQVKVSFWLQSYSRAVTAWLIWIPNWAAAVVLLGAVGLLAWRAIAQTSAAPARGEPADDQGPVQTPGERHCH